jgi:hypothetical protein
VLAVRFDDQTMVAAAPLIVDTRNAIKTAHPHVFTLGAPPLMPAERWQPAGASERSA